VQSTTQGFLPPRMTAAQMGIIPSPAEGLAVYCTNCSPKGLRVFNGVAWEDMNGVLPTPAAFTFTGNYYHDPNFSANKVMAADNTLYLQVNVTTVGQIAISSGTANGYSFSGFPVTSATGVQFIAVQAIGTQAAYNVAGDSFTITGVGTTTETQAITIANSQNGSAFTSFSNGTENFSANTVCARRGLSTTTAGNCPATVTVGSNTYNTVFINDQCWFRENLREVPTAPCADALNTGCNTWLNTSPGDIGSWGFYNNTTTNGSAGWRTTEPAANEGMLYQWSAAMNGSTSERAKGVCPVGWHVPSDCEWMYLEHGLGMSIAQQSLDAWRSTTAEGTKLRSVGGTGATLWNNSSGFTGLLSGARNINGSFFARSTSGYYWSSTRVGGSARARELNSGQVGVRRFTINPAIAFSVRCLKD
jgi:uncharacterized protein (TIGR02145 family)